MRDYDDFDDDRRPPILDWVERILNITFLIAGAWMALAVITIR